MAERATYVSKNWDKADVYLRPGLRAPLSFEAVDEETGDPVTFTRISDDSMTCHPVTSPTRTKGGKTTYITKKCGNEECHRRDPGTCQCGLHPDFRHPSGQMSRGVNLERAK